MADNAKTRASELQRILADDIITGRIKAGARLDEQSLADRFAVSRTPVREALRHLGAIGLVERGPQRSVYVGHVSHERLTELFELMAELEGICARLAAQRMSATERRDLEDLHRRSAEVMRSGNQAGYGEANARFHGLIYAGTHNRTIEDAALSTRARLAPYRLGQFKVLGRLGRSFAEHDEVVQAILRGDGAEAQAAMLRHVALVSDASATYVAGSRPSADEDRRAV